MFRTAIAAMAITVLALPGCGSGSEADASPGGASSPAGTTETTVSTGSTGSTSPSKEQSVCPNPHGGDCLGDLEPGTYRTSTFKPRITYTVQAGWHNAEDLPGNFQLYQQEDSQDGALGGSYLGIYQNVDAAAINCDEAKQEGVGSTPAELVAWYESIPGLVVSPPRTVTVGGLRGFQIDLALEPGVDTCSYDQYRGIPLFIGNGVSQVHHVILEEIDVRLVILGWRKGNVMMEITNVKTQHSADEFRAALQPILNSLRFQG